MTKQTAEEITDEDGEVEKTTKYQKHVCNSVGIKFNSIHDQYSENEVIFNNADIKELLKCMVLKLEDYAIKSYKLIKQNEKLDYKTMSKELKKFILILNAVLITKLIFQIQ